MIPLFRAIAIAEGISFLLLMGFSMPLKYWAGIPEPNLYIGYAHGVLFIAYALLAIWVCYELQWGFKRFLVLFVASLLPFGTFYIEQKYLKKEGALAKG
ncbi:DUF3817 domain-containing protein [Zeaxanthinibacter enoshimensis]|uniref:Integral membrane protein n=1 Tax=Zeaxanthinibacter enoshimensis TaxID=392009 RepID=A0A4R6TKJ4_9FLAO|nr:DUF3817 domain-containing protein [Zeaxanthinibacter enoshimensis]TDQ30982.1 integral membrane protein [Zeaxanthinibacter enoshimensis]